MAIVLKNDDRSLTLHKKMIAAAPVGTMWHTGDTLRSGGDYAVLLRKYWLHGNLAEIVIHHSQSKENEYLQVKI
ncbi:MAG: hypothetical protein Q4G02_00285 [bacterium]|nr:hypothetical protein [bacterium]